MKAQNSQLGDEDRDRVAIKLLFGIADEWSLSDNEICILLGLADPSMIDGAKS